MNSRYMYVNYIKESMTYYYLIVALFSMFLPAVTLIGTSSNYDEYILTTENKSQIIITKLFAILLVIMYYSLLLLILLYLIPYLLVDYMNFEINALKYSLVAIIYSMLYCLNTTVIILKFDNIFGLFILIVSFLIMKLSVDEIAYMESIPLYSKILQIVMPILSIGDSENFAIFITVPIFVTILVSVLVFIEATMLYRKNSFS